MPWGNQRFQVDYVVGEWWSEYATAPNKDNANKIAVELLRQGKTVRVSRVCECIELGNPMEPSHK